MKKSLSLLITAMVLSGCANDPSGYLKRSANNRLIDASGMHNSKRRPTLNREYIKRAKHNIANNNIDEELEELALREEDLDNFDEYADYKLLNREMYEEMLERDLQRQAQREELEKRKKRIAQKSMLKSRKSHYPKLRRNSQNARRVSEYSREDSPEVLQEEMSEIKTMLAAAREDLAKLKCPYNKPSDEVTPDQQEPDETPAEKRKLTTADNIRENNQTNKTVTTPANSEFQEQNQ